MGEGAAALATGAWPELERLFLTDNEIGYLGALALLAAPWPKLRTLWITGNGLGDGAAAAEAAIMARWPGLNVWI